MEKLLFESVSKSIVLPSHQSPSNELEDHIVAADISAVGEESYELILPVGILAVASAQPKDPKRKPCDAPPRRFAYLPNDNDPNTCSVNDGHNDEYLGNGK